MIAAVAKAPVVALVDCEAKAFKNYKSGIITTCDGGLHNHVVLIVGYGVENGVKYWRVKNSFGQQWGEAGYVRIERDTNQCGIGGELYTVVGAKAWPPPAAALPDKGNMMLPKPLKSDDDSSAGRQLVEDRPAAAGHPSR